jgi:recombination protein RecA
MMKKIFCDGAAVVLPLLLLIVPRQPLVFVSAFSFSSIQSKTASNRLTSYSPSDLLISSSSSSSCLWARRKSVPPEESSSNSIGNADDGSSNNIDNSIDNVDPAKEAALQGVLNQIERAYGRGSIMKLGDDSSATGGSNKYHLQCISSGSLTLDVALGGGGYPRGRIVEIYGPESSGKTTLALHAIAAAQKAQLQSNSDGGGSGSSSSSSKNGTSRKSSRGKAAFIDAEHALDPAYAAACGVDIDNLLVCQPDSGEMALDVVDQLVRSAAVDVIVVDSVAALVPRVELEGDMMDQSIGLQARLMSKAMRKITGSLARSGTATVIFINQLRSKVGVIYGSPEVTSGGNALKYYASVRLDTRRKEILPDNAGIRIQVKVVKNKIAAPFRVVLLDILFASGLDSMGCLLDCACDLDIVQRRGSWYAYQGQNVAQGRTNVVQLLKENVPLAMQLEQDVRRQLKAMRSTTRPSALAAAAAPPPTPKDSSSIIDSIDIDSDLPPPSFFSSSSSSSSSSMEEESYL